MILVRGSACNGRATPLPRTDRRNQPSQRREVNDSGVLALTNAANGGWKVFTGPLVRSQYRPPLEASESGASSVFLGPHASYVPDQGLIRVVTCKKLGGPFCRPAEFRC